MVGSITNGEADGSARRGPLARRDFRLMWGGQAVSALGDQFAFVALPWLALVVTGSALALGGVLAVMAVPRAAFMLFGGVYVDRFSPRRVMLIANVGRLVAVTGLAVAVLAGDVGLPLLYLFAVVFGIADAFFLPAQQAIIPELVIPDEIPAANALAQASQQLIVFVGPALAGIVIGLLGTSGPHPSLRGIAAALLIDALSFLASIGTLAVIRAPGDRESAGEPVVGAIRSAIAFVWGWPSLRVIVLFAMGINLLVVGPLNVGLATIAYTRLPEGATAYATVMSAIGGGSLLGMVAVMALPQPRANFLGSFVLLVMATMGMGVAGLGLTTATVVAIGLAALVGFGMGYANLMLITWAQQRIPRALMGRVFSLILLGSVALVPVSQIAAGALVAFSLTAMLVAAGGLMTVLTIVAALIPAVRGMGLEPVLTSSVASEAGRA